MKKLIVFSGAGISAESGLKTFRDTGGLWEEYDINEVATPEAWNKNPKLVLEFYNKRREQAINAIPNAAHKALAELEKHFDVSIITQNIDDLHERAGSRHVLHLHGQITKCKSVVNDHVLYDVEAPLQIGDTDEHGDQLRPHVVWFGEAVPEYDNAERLIRSAEILVIVGTSLNVFPAAGLIHFAQDHIPMYLIDPGEVAGAGIEKIVAIKENACTGVPIVANELISKFAM